MTKVLAQTYRIAETHQRHITLALLAACAFSVLIYALNVYRVISHTVALEAIQKQTTTISSSVDALDTEYLGLSSKASPDTLKDYGFEQGQVSAFISRTTSLGTVASRANEL